MEIDSFFKKKKISPSGNYEMAFKCVLWLCLWMTTWYSIILFKDTFWLAFLIGLAHMFCHIMIAFNIIHDANHYAMFKSPRLNKLFGYLIELLGSNRKLWVISHNQEHHSYINIFEHDNNIDGYGLLRLCPYDKWTSYHKYQWLYAPIVYGFSTLNYATLREVKMFLTNRDKFTFADYVEFFLFKSIYYAYLFIIPIVVFQVSFKLILAYFLVGHFVNGLFLALIFLTGHLTINTAYPVVKENTVHKNWAHHVISTTGDYGTTTNLLQWLVGGINLHIAHHLFPSICHVHYKKVSPIIKRVATKHGLVYREIPSFTNALKSHFSLLKALGLPPEQLAVEKGYNQ